jgi:hypothetical protein
MIWGESVTLTYCNITRESPGAAASDVPIVSVPDDEGGDT